MLHRQKKFNLIEILVSFIVIVFSLFVLLSLFPLSMRQTEEATNLNYVAGLTESVSSYIKTLPLDDNSTLSLNNFPTTKPTSDTTRSNFPSFPSGSSSSSAYDNADDVAFNTVILNNNNFNSSSTVSESSSPSENNGIFLISAFEDFDINNTPSDSNDDVRTKLVEIEARIWHSEITAVNSSPATNFVTTTTFGDKALEPTSSSDNIKFPILSRVNIEFSWPVNRKYDERQKKYFFLTVNRLTD